MIGQRASHQDASAGIHHGHAQWTAAVLAADAVLMPIQPLARASLCTTPTNNSWPNP